MGLGESRLSAPFPALRIIWVVHDCRHGWMSEFFSCHSYVEGPLGKDPGYLPTGMGLDQWSFFYQPRLEVCRFDYVDRSQTSIHSKKLAHGSIEKNVLVASGLGGTFCPSRKGLPKCVFD